jgi:type I restriction enzyme, S subunit
LLKEIIDNRGKSVPTVENGFPLIATNCIKHSSIYPTFERVRFVSEQTMKTWFRSHLQPNDILFVNKGTPGRVCLVPDTVNFCVAQDMIGFRCDEKKINYKYLFAVLRSNEIQKKIENNHVGLVIPHFRKQDLSDLLIPIRREEEQESIGDLYLTLSQKIELNNRINSELEGMAKTLYDYWFVQFDFPDENGKPYKSSGGKMIWNDELKREIPDGWEVGTTSDLFEFNPTLSIKSFDTASYIDMNALPTSGFMTKNVQKKQFTGGVKFQNGDLVVARITPCLENGKTGLITLLDENEVGFGSTEFIVIRGKKKSLSGFASFLARSELFRKYAIANMLGTSGRKRVEANSLKKFKLAIPDSSLLDKFEEMTKSFLDVATINTKQNQQLSNLRDWLLPMLMNGQVKVIEN